MPKLNNAGKIMVFFQMCAVVRDFEAEIKLFKGEIQRLSSEVKAKDEENKQIKNEKEALSKDLETKTRTFNEERQSLNNTIRAKNAEIENLRKKKDTINILCVFPERALGRLSFLNLGFIDKLNNENQLCTIKRQLITDTALREIIDNVKGDYINEFDILLIGLCDSSGSYSSQNPNGLTNASSQGKIMEFHRRGGKILLLHDAMEYFDCITQITGRKSNLSFKGSSSVRFIPSSHVLMTTPFSIGSRSSIAFSHQGFRFANLTPVIAFEGVNETYYQENLSKRVALCEVGHSGTMNNYEERLLYNIIYRLYKC